MTYKKMPASGNVDGETALLQGAAALDAAAVVAEKTNDVEGLLNAAAMWLRFSEAIDHYATVANAEEAKQQEILKGSTIQIGFQANSGEIVAEEEENE